MNFQIYQFPSIAQKVALRWKAVREKFAVKYKKFYFSGIDPTWEFYDQCQFLIPFVNLSSSRKKSSACRDSDDEDTIRSFTQQPIRFDESNLIEHIRQRPVIYDRNHKDFRSASIRNKAWKDIARTTGWKIDFMQKRWRVIRDRFVRELRKTNYSKTTVSTSPIFANMLFLAPHIKSKTYAVETEFEDYSNEEEDEASHDDVRFRNENFDTTSNENIEANSEVIEEEEVYHHENVETFDDNQMYRLYEEAEVLEEMHEDHNVVTAEGEEEYSDDDTQEETIFENDEEYLNSVAFEQVEADSNDIEPNVQIQAPTSKKRKLSKYFEEVSSPMKIVCSETFAVKDEQESTKSIHETSMAMSDEDLAFGQTIGLMLKKIPYKLKTAIKLKIFQCLDDFELQHNLK